MIEKKLVQKFGDFEEIEPKSHIYVFRPEYESKPVGIYFVDVGESPFQKGFNIDEYQNRFIIEDYYSNPGSLQWNYYLIFIIDTQEYNKPNFQELKKEIESNNDYSRKYLIAENNIDEWLAQPLIPMASGKGVSLDNISVRWTEKLNNVGLNQVNSKKGIIPLVDEFIEDPSPKISPKIKRVKSIKEDIGLGKLMQLYIMEYRQNKLTGKHDIKPVTLLSGPNGVGKTSFIEAIELCICGQTLRSGNQAESNAKIHLTFEDGTKLIYPSKDNSYYRMIDNNWYNNPYSRDNYLSKSFGRYNFFDTDAAQKLSSESGSEEISKAFIKIALGSEVNFLEKRIQDSYSRFKTKDNALTNKISKLSKILKEEKEHLVMQNKILQEPGSFFKSLQFSYKKTNWKGDAPKKHSDSTENSFLQVRNTIESMESLRSTLSWVKKPIFSSINQENKRLILAITHAKKTRLSLTELNEQLGESIESKERVENQFEILQATKPYYTESKIEKLVGLNKKIQEGQVKISILRDNVKILSKIDLDKFVSLDDTFHEFEAGLKSSNNILSKELKKKKIEMENLQEKYGQIESLIAEIKSLGLNLLEEDSARLSCPLCKTSFKKGALLERIKHFEMSHKDESSLLDPLSREIKRKDRTLKKIKKQLSSLESIAQVGLDHWESEKFTKLPLRTIVEELVKFPNLLQETSKTVREYSDLSDYFTHRALEESEFIELSESISSEYSGMKISYKQRKKLESLELSNKRKLGELNDIILNLKKNINKMENELMKAAKKEFEIENDLESYEVLINRRYEKVILAESYYDFIRQNVTVKPEDSILRVAKLLEGLSDKLEEYEQVQIDRKSTTLEIKRSEQRIDQIVEEKENFAKYQERGKYALNCLNDLLTKDSKNNAADKFINEYQASILQIFKKLHVPNEFDDIEFKHNNSSVEISLKRSLTNEWCLISEISSGQRSALALSIFLSLNLSAIKAPPIIMFDDPVSHTDDMNILSFLDFLRDIVLKSNKQIVFSTANHRIANLFSKKFSFLDAKFSRIDLSHHD